MTLLILIFASIYTANRSKLWQVGIEFDLGLIQYIQVCIDDNGFELRAIQPAGFTVYTDGTMIHKLDKRHKQCANKKQI